jgi:enoyl-CoA hydratase/carnithine racemase
VRADSLPAGSIEVVPDETSFEDRISALAEEFSDNFAPQPQALGKWAFHTQAGFSGGSTGDGFEEAVSWTGRVMALHARGADAREGMQAFFEKRKPSWKTLGDPMPSKL